MYKRTTSCPRICIASDGAGAAAFRITRMTARDNDFKGTVGPFNSFRVGDRGQDRDSGGRARYQLATGEGHRK
jgi:hypothetical protein